MPINPSLALGANLPSMSHRWDTDDVILYHLGLGAGWQAPTDPAELAYTYEPDLKVLPSFGVIPPFPVIAGLGGVPGMDVNFARVLHGEQDLQVHGAIPTSADSTTTAAVTELWDKGKAALIVVEAVTSVGGQPLFTNRFSIFARGEGGFGGEAGPDTTVAPPERPPDHVIESPTLPHQALIYRLSGDKNPLHADPAYAALGGFDTPILHGLSTYGVVAKAVVDNVLDGETSAVARYRARFAGVVYPGETIVSSIWEAGDRILVRATTKEREEPVLSNVEITRA